ncbi:hypothetical protein [Photobacterium swingsii]|uniref:hypothetical protein n=1 Tax=Photobacterium swingsii TaxID=680026 RepID=UPI0040688A95
MKKIILPTELEVNIDYINVLPNDIEKFEKYAIEIYMQDHGEYMGKDIHIIHGIHTRSKVGFNSTKLLIEDLSFGKGWLWGTPWTPMISKLKSHGTRPAGLSPKRQNQYRRTELEYFQDLSILKPHLIFVESEPFQGGKTKVSYRCSLCGTKGSNSLKKLIHANDCSGCAEYARTEKKKKTLRYYLEVINTRNPNLKNLTLSGEFIGNKSTLSYKCGVCNKKGTMAINHLTMGKGCNKCSHLGKYTENYFIKNPHKKTISSSVYYNKFYNPITSQTVYKIGIDSTGMRWGKKYKEWVITKNIVFRGTLYECYKFEQNFLKDSCLNLYKHSDFIGEGSSEIFTNDILGLFTAD